MLKLVLSTLQTQILVENIFFGLFALYCDCLKSFNKEKCMAVQQYVLFVNTLHNVIFNLRPLILLQTINASKCIPVCSVSATHYNF